MYLIERNEDLDYPLLDANGKDILINGCSGPSVITWKVDNRKNTNLGDYIMKATDKCKYFQSRSEAYDYMKNNHIDGKVYFYGGCGCCGCSYEDDDGIIKNVTWPQFYPKDSTPEEIAKLNKQLEDYDNYVQRNKHLLKNGSYLHYGENLLCGE